ncbi:MAG: hypothetical protein H6Q37_2160 [Chloroflexi bacterium]|nr:hypothetical protein [Chloroflexota bacterium]
MKRNWILPLAVLVLAAIAGAVYWLSTPRLSGFAPQNNALDVPAGTELRLTFSRAMQPDDVIQRLKIDPPTPGKYRWEGNTLVFTPVQSWEAGTTVQVKLAAGARANGRLALPLIGDTAWSFSIRQPRLLYLYPSDSPANIYIYNPRTEKSQPVTDAAAGVLEYDVTPDGGAIYYSAQNSLGGSDIYRLELSGDSASAQAVQVLACQQAQCRAPSIAPGEDLLAYELTSSPASNQAGYPRVWLLPLVKGQSADGKVTVKPAKESRLAGDPAHQTSQPDWSPNGNLSYYDSTQKAFIVLDPHSGKNTALPNQTGEPGSWSPDSTVYVAAEIFFNAGGSGEPANELQPVASSHLLRFNVTDGTIQDLTQTENLEDTTPVFSPDGSQLALARKYLDAQRWTPGRQLWVMRANGASAQQLTDEPDYNHFDFAWSPTGSQIAFVRFNQTAPTDLPMVLIYDLPRGFASEVVTGGYAPHWIP